MAAFLFSGAEKYIDLDAKIHYNLRVIILLTMFKYEEAITNCEKYFNGDTLAAKVVVDKYLLKDNDGNLVEDSPEMMHRRIAKEFARIEKKKFKEPLSEGFIFNLLDRFKYIIPQGSPMFGIGNNYQVVSLSNCFLLDEPLDNYNSILDVDKQLVNISKRRGGVGIDLSNLRPAGSPVKNAAKAATGIVSWMERYSNSIREVGQHNRRGALMLTISINHPDIIDFCTIKNDPTKVTGANISVRLNKEFLDAVKNDTDYELRWPINSEKPKISKMISAKKVWDIIIDSAHGRAEPGLLMWDNVIKETPADYYEAYASKGCNPCSELVLANLDSCRLLVLNLLSYVLNPYTTDAKFDFKTFHQHARVAQRLMDDLVDLESEKVDKIIEKIQSDPEPDSVKSGEIAMWRKIKKLNDEGRRTGTGITALGDAIAALNVKYGSEESIKITGDIYKALKLAAYESSVDMAEELGHFVGWSHEAEKDCPFIDRMKVENRDLYEKMSKIGRRNVSLTTTAPTGSLSILTQTTSGIEPLFMIGYTRRRKINPEESANKKVDFVDQNGDKWEENTVYHAQIANWMKITGKTDVKESPWYGACAEEINWVNRVKLQSEAQLHTCHSISSTLNLPEDVSKETVATIYQTAFESGCKGITVYRKNCRTGVLIEKPEKKNDEQLVKQTSAPKRPKTLSCDVHHLNYDSKRYYAVVGLLNEAPYEIFVGVNSDTEGDVIVPKSIKSGVLRKEARKKYILENSESSFSCNISNGHSDENADVLGRLISTSLRHGTPIEFIVHQLEKTHGGLTSFSKVLCRTLKKYIKDGTKVSGEKCPGCGSENVERSSGCVTCKECSWSKC